MIGKYAMPQLMARLMQIGGMFDIWSSDGPAAFLLVRMFTRLRAAPLSFGRGPSRRGGQRTIVLRRAIPKCKPILMAAAVVMCVPGAGRAQCNEEAAAHCQSTMSNCRANCDRVFHREEANQACRLECQSHNASCGAEARCKAGQQ